MEAAAPGAEPSPPSGRWGSLLSVAGARLEVAETLKPDDPILTTPLLELLELDAADIGGKLKLVLLPSAANRSELTKRLGEGDFWGPLICCFVLSVLSLEPQWVLTLWLLGSSLMFVVARALGAECTFGVVSAMIGYGTAYLDSGAALGGGLRFVVGDMGGFLQSGIGVLAVVAASAISASALASFFPAAEGPPGAAPAQGSGKTLLLLWPQLLVFSYLQLLCT